MSSRIALALLVVTAFAALASRAPVSDSDLFWHLATGQQTLAGGLARSDAFSWTIPGRPILTDQWLGDLLFALAFALGDWRGIIALRVLAVAALVALVVDAALRERPGRPLVVVLATLPAIALSRFAWTDRPQLLGLALFAAMMWLLRARDRRARFAAVPLLLVWANLHGSYALGLGVLLLALAAEAVAEPAARRQLALVAVAAIAVTLLTPSGLQTWTQSGGHFLAPPRYVEEEGVPDPRTLPGAIYLVTLALVLVTAMLSRPSLREIALIVPVAFVSLTAERHTPFLAVAAAPYFARVWPDPLAAWRAEPAPRRAAPGAATTAALALALAVVFGAVVLAPGVPDEGFYPVATLAALPAGPGLLNAYDWGGWLIFRAPATPVFIDGRLFPYVPEVLDDYRAVVGLHPDWRAVLTRRGVRALLVRPSDAIAVRAQDLGWRVLAGDGTFVLIEVPR